MCVAVPGKVLKIEAGAAEVDFLGVVRRVAVELIPDVAVGDYVLVHAGCAIKKLLPEEAEETQTLFRRLQEMAPGGVNLAKA